MKREVGSGWKVLTALAWQQSRQVPLSRSSLSRALRGQHHQPADVLYLSQVSCQHFKIEKFPIKDAFEKNL